MAHLPAGDDYDGWVAQLGSDRRRALAKGHLLRAGARAVPAIRRGLDHPKPIVRRACVNLLDHLVDEGSVADLVAALDDPDPDVKRRALHALACDQCKENACRPGEHLFVPRAISFLRPESAQEITVRAGAIDTLGKVAAHRDDATAALAYARDNDPDPGMRNMARRELQRAERLRQRYAGSEGSTAARNTATTSAP